jgi:hypothetical protein
MPIESEEAYYTIHVDFEDFLISLCNNMKYKANQ